MTFNGNRYRYHSGLLMNSLQPSGYCTCRQGQKHAFVFPTYFICVFRTFLSINSKYTPYTVMNECVSNGGTLYSRWGKQRFKYRWQKPEASVHSNALVTHSIPFLIYAVPLNISNASLPFDLYFSTRGVWNKNGKIKTLRRASESETGSDRLDLKRQQEFHFSYGLLYPSIDICFAIRVLDIGVLFFKGSLPRNAKVLIFELISYRSAMELNANSSLNKSFLFWWT